ncbi:MAG: DNA modification methylase [Desulfocapsaceae bacterium]|nr:DNA modification methylase [Desulfocapsaceae bacterium]
MRKIASLIPYENNPRKNDHAVEKVAAAIREFGFRVPVLIKNDGSIVDGHLRYKAALAAGLTEIPCMLADDMTDTQIRAFRISVNKVAELAKWDEGLLKIELEALMLNEYDLSFIGFDEYELDDLMGSEKESPGQDNVPPAPVVPVSKQGDLWIMGDHLLLCGDATCPDDYKRLLSGNCVDMICTDPPYNVDYHGKAGNIKNDSMSSSDFTAFINQATSEMVKHLTLGGACYVAHADSGEIGIQFRRAFIDAGMHLAACLIWRKSHFVLGRSDYQFMHEPILYGWKIGAGHAWYGGRKKRSIVECDQHNILKISDTEYQLKIGDEILSVTGKDIHIEHALSSVLSEERPVISIEHPTMKPVALFERFIKNSSKIGHIVLDGFGGSGTTMIACEKFGRHCRMMEIEEKFVDVIVTRWQQFSGKKAILAGPGKSFDELSAERS